MSITIERLPSEREHHAAAIAPAGACSCCCCCCCLHTLGSVVAAATTKPPQPPTNAPTAIAGSKMAAPKYSIARDYWLTVLVIATLGFPAFVIPTGARADTSDFLLAYALLLPAVQLAASLVVLIFTSISKRPGRDERLRHLGAITLRSFVGALIGIVTMAVVFSAL
jgi:hypothetical protein